MSGTDGELLGEHFPLLAKRLAEAGEPRATLVLEAAASGEPTLRVNGILAHSARDPRREARKLAELSRGAGPLVVLGSGLCYFAEAAAEADPERPLIIVERDPAVLALAFKNRDLSRLVSRKGTVFVVGGPPEGVTAALDAFGGEPRIVSNKALRATDDAWFQAVESAVRTWMDKDAINAATLKRFGKRWVRNLASNLDSIRDLPGIALLAGRAAGLPALIVAAGPSLDETLPLLGALAKRCVVIAVDTALRALTAYAVHPDFLLVVDPQFWNARHLDRCSSPKTALITESAVYPSVLRTVSSLASPHAYQRTFLCASHYPLGRFIEDRVDAKGELGAGGSVATTAWDFARVLGASPLWIAGLDLSFPDLKTHFKGALFEERAHGESDRFRPAELRSFRALRDGLPFQAADASGGKVLTDKRLSLYAAWFESRFRLHADARPRSLSGRGLRIAGLEPCSIQEILSLPERREEIDERLSRAFSEAEASFRDDTSMMERGRRYEAAVAELSHGLGEIARVARRAESECGAALAALSAGSDRAAAEALDFLDGVNEQIASASVKDVAGFLFPPIAALEAELGPANGDKLRRHLELSRRLYERLAESAEYHGSILSPHERKR